VAELTTNGPVGFSALANVAAAWLN
jgi:hypothetical protein